MEPVFTLPYGEYSVANELGKIFKKSDGYSILIPTSRQQKGFDLVVYNSETKKAVSIQVKSSRTYNGTIPKRKSLKQRFKHYTWFNKFDLEEGSADFYILFGLYSTNLEGKKLDHCRDPKKWYSQILLIFSEEQMIRLMKSFDDSKFSFGFNNSENIFLTRGKKLQENEDELSSYLFDKKVHEIKDFLKK